MIIALLLAQAQLTRLQVAYAAETPVPLFIDSPVDSIKYWTEYYHVPYDEVYQTLVCESGLQSVQSHYPDPTGPNGREDSWGVAQIYLPKHPSITREMAMSPDFAVKYIASHWYTDHWSCAKQLGFYGFDSS